ncbi:MAG: DUF5009 domain-containing protein [Phycisphaerales bacterium]|jgi:predicted acyltransferase|nr:DUF5009 domain-containing protein [Phycisphaeraceae bacterium]
MSTAPIGAAAPRTATPPPAKASGPRLLALDAFRGMDIALMFFVNLSASRAAFPEWFGHAGWNNGEHGYWLADVVFPWFLFIVGCAIPFSMSGGRGREQTVPRRFVSAFRRALVIYMLGIAIWIAKSAKGETGTPITWTTFLHWDILPLIALGYFVGVIVYHLPRWTQIVLFAAILWGKWYALPDLTQTVGLDRAAWMKDRVDIEHSIRSLGPVGDWMRTLVDAKEWPEVARILGVFAGWLGTAITQGLPACAAVIGGVLTGEYLRNHDASIKAKAGVLIGLGGVLCALAAAWAHPALGAMPFSKDFFTPTYVLFSVASGMVALGALVAILDAWTLPRWMFSLIGAGLMAASFGVCAWLIDPSTDLGRSQLTSCAIALGMMFAVFVAWAVVDLLLLRDRPAKASFWVIYGSNAIAVYFLAELTWTLFWMHFRVMGPGSFGSQFAFPALQVHWAAFAQEVLSIALTDRAAAEVGRGLGPWLATGTYLMIYWVFCYELWRRRIFIKV